MMRAGRKQNYLDQIPVRSLLCPWKEEAGKAVLAVEHKGILYAFTQRVFHKPRVSYITLDVYGTAVWKQIDGEKTVGEISDGLEQQFPEAQGDMLSRVVVFFSILQANGFVHMRRIN